MNELQTQSRQLPDTLTDLSKFVLVGREKLNAVRAEIRAIEKVQLAAEVHEQKLQEAQEIAEAVLDAETKLGELTSKMEKAVNQYSAKDSGVRSTKSEQLEQIGITEKQKQRFETLAKHPKTVEQAKADARAEGRIVTRQDVLNRIVTPKPKRPTIKDTIENARQEHEEFRATKQDAVVSFADAVRDQENAQMVTLDTEIRIRKALQSLEALELISDADIKEMADSLKDYDKSILLSQIRGNIRTLIHITNYLGG